MSPIVLSEAPGKKIWKKEIMKYDMEKRLRLIARDYDARPRQFELPDPSPRCDLLYNRSCKMRRAKAWSE